MVRQAFGIEGLDAMLGGGLLPGTLTVIAGATGAGKTQIGLKWADRGLAAEGRRGVICDLSSRGDAQNHEAYALDQFAWQMAEHVGRRPGRPRAVSSSSTNRSATTYHPFDQLRPPGDPPRPRSRRVARLEVGPRPGPSRFGRLLLRALHPGIAGASSSTGSSRPSGSAESIQFEFFEYLYQHVLRKEDEWAAREVFRERYTGRTSENVEAHRYDHKSIGCLYLYTTPHILLDDLMAQPIGEGDIFSNANTVILMGRTKEAGRMGRALYVAKHRGSAGSDEIRPYRLTDRGMEFDGTP